MAYSDGGRSVQKKDRRDPYDRYYPAIEMDIERAASEDQMKLRGAKWHRRALKFERVAVSNDTWPEKRRAMLLAFARGLARHIRGCVEHWQHTEAILERCRREAVGRA